MSGHDVTTASVVVQGFRVLCHRLTAVPWLREFFPVPSIAKLRYGSAEVMAKGHTFIILNDAQVYRRKNHLMQLNGSWISKRQCYLDFSVTAYPGVKLVVFCDTLFDLYTCRSLCGGVSADIFGAASQISAGVPSEDIFEQPRPLVCITYEKLLGNKILLSLSPKINKYSEQTSPLPSGWFNWMKPFYQTPDTVVLNHSSLDGFLFLRYMKVLCIICVFGMVLTWPILIPFHVHGGGTNIQLDLLTFGNVMHAQWFYVHAILAWIFFGKYTGFIVREMLNKKGFILYMVARESVYFISLRQAYLLSPLYANRLSSRVVLFTCVPQQTLDERKLRRIFGDTVKNIWIPRDTEELDQLVKEREQTANRLERAEITLIKKANAAWKKTVKNGHPDAETNLESPASGFSKEPEITVLTQSPTSPTSPTSPISQVSSSPVISPISPREFARSDGTPILKTSYGLEGPPPDINGSVANQWLPYSQRPVHRPIANYGRRVDTIKWTRNRLKKLAPEIGKLRGQYRKGKGKPIPAVFIEFHTQVDAQSAYQTLAHHRANHMRPEIVGVRPQEIIWSSLRMAWWERIIRKFLIQGFIAVMVIFWSLPAAVVGIVSNISSLTQYVHFLSFLDDLPAAVLGLLAGLVPPVALACLMMSVPVILRGLFSPPPLESSTNIS
ncbi:hypothetical protein G7Y89_g4484 [Cudoniella acicularis]|uniref:CSC1/OSCA1-like 7TM region domain-containing protein n=1 Tax=Cudoniella acicularis TaxID=354080 RepID=A0A8H4W4Y3_9HELO|nr:hypothetical protein G7Y89_g4484 [Cudoniella acicularis]